MVDKPSNQKSSIGTLSGSAKTSGGTQQRVRSWAAPVTDTGLGQLAQGLSQAGQGVSQLAAAFRKRKEENDELNTLARAQGYASTVPLLEQQVQQEVDSGEITPEQMAERFDQLNKDALATWQPEDKKQLQQFQLKTTPIYSAARTREVNNSYKRQIAAQTAATVKTVEQANEVTAQVAAVGDVNGTMVSIAQGATTAKRLAEQLANTDPKKALALIQGYQSQAAQSILTAAHVSVLKAEDPEAAVAEIEKTITNPEVVQLFTNNQAAYRQLRSNLDSVVASAAKERQQQLKNDAGRTVDADYALATDIESSGTFMRLTESQYNALDEDDQIKYDVALMASTLRGKINNVYTLGNDQELDNLRAEALEAGKELAIRYQAQYNKAVSALFASAVSNRDASIVASQRAAGTSDANIAAGVMRRNNNNVQVSFNKLNGAEADATLSRIRTALKSGTKNVGNFVVTELTNLVGGLTPIDGYDNTKMALSYMLDKAPDKGTRRALGVAAMLPTLEGTEATNFEVASLINAAYEGVKTSSVLSKGFTESEMMDIRAAVAKHPVMQALIDENRANLQGGDVLEMAGYMAEAATAVAVLKSPDSNKATTQELAETAVDYLGNITSRTPSGEKVVPASLPNTGGYDISRLRLPESQRTKWEDTKYRKNAFTYIAEELKGLMLNERVVGVGDPVKLAGKKLRVRMASGGSGIAFFYGDGITENPVSVRAKDGTVRPWVVTFSEIDDGVAAIKDAGLLKPSNEPQASRIRRTLPNPFGVTGGGFKGSL